MIEDRIPLKKKLKSGKPCIGSWITLGNAGVAEIMARVGFEWLVIDLEHSVISIDLAGDLIRTVDLCGVAPLVRLTSNDADQIKRVMDAGAEGIVVPQVNSPGQAKAAVDAVRYAPDGKRGVGLGRAQGYGTRFQEYFGWQKQFPVVIVQIEHQEAIDHLEEILAVEGVDGYFIGPYDLSCSMGIPGEFQHASFTKALDRIRESGARQGAVGGLHIVEPDIPLLKQKIDEGFRFIAYSVDIRILDVGAREAVNFLNSTKP